MNIPQSLVEIGLESKEAQIYSWLLKQPKSADHTVFSISKGVSMPRSTVYVILQSLEDKKLVSSYKKNNVLRYLTASPSRLQKNLDEKQDALRNLMPTLEALAKDTAFTPSVRTFTGEKGVIAVFDDIYDKPLEKGVTGYHTLSNPKLIKYLGKRMVKYMELKKGFNLHTKIMIPHAFSVNTPKEYLPDSHRETRFLPEGFFFDGAVVVYGRKTALFSHRDGEVISMIVESSAITEMIDAMFMCLWDLLKENTIYSPK